MRLPVYMKALPCCHAKALANFFFAASSGKEKVAEEFQRQPDFYSKYKASRCHRHRDAFAIITFEQIERFGVQLPYETVSTVSVSRDL